MLNKPHFDKIQAFFSIWWKDIQRCDVFHHAYSMAYVSLLSLIPSLSAIFAVLSLFSPLLESDSQFIGDVRRFLLEHLASGSGAQVVSQIEGFLQNLDVRKIGLTGFAGTLVTLILLLKQIEMALNRIFQVKNRGILLADS